MIVNDNSKGIVSLVICIGFLGIFAGLALAGSDIVNPWTSQAVAAQTAMQTSHEAAINRIDLNHYQQERQ